MQQQQQSFSQQQSKHRSHFFLFVNCASGSGIGQKIMKQQVEQICFRIPLPRHNRNDHHAHARVFIYNMKQHRKKGFTKLRKTVDSGKRAVAVIVGGDGTVTWVVSQFANYGIDADLVPIAIIPVGTGNDFSQQLGWGTQQNNILANSFQGLKKLVRQWIQAREQYFDLWQVVADIYEEKGKFEIVKQGRSQTLPQKKITRHFVNYFSFGMDGKIGYSFDMHRTSTRLGNLAMYGILGVIKAMTKTKKVQELIETVQIRKDLSDQIPKQSRIVFHGLKKQGQGGQFSSQIQQTASRLQTNSQIKKIGKQRESKIELIQKQEIKGLDTNQRCVINFEKGYCNFVALNINSFMGGVKDIWMNASNRQKTQVQCSIPSTSDGKLEFISFHTSVGMASERLFKGQADRITQGDGPYLIKFKKYENQQKHRTYLQIDGQFIRFTHPKSIVIRKSELTINGKIKVLRKKQSHYN